MGRLVAFEGTRASITPPDSPNQKGLAGIEINTCKPYIDSLSSDYWDSVIPVIRPWGAPPAPTLRWEPEQRTAL